LIEQNHGRWAESQAALESAFDPDPLSTAETLAIHYLHLRAYSDARRFIDLAMTANRSGVTVPAAWERFRAAGDVAEARQVLETALAARPSADARVLGLLARLEWFDGRYDRALELIGRMDQAGAPGCRRTSASPPVWLPDRSTKAWVGTTRPEPPMPPRRRRSNSDGR
jgi:hypothetical protein